MRQNTLSVPLEIKPDSCGQLNALIDNLRTQDQPAGYPDQFQRLLSQVPSLHFMALTVFPASNYDPLFVLEANFDGPPGVFWGQLEATFGSDLRAMLRCCKRPLDKDGPLFDAVIVADSRAPVAPYFEARTQRPSVFHHGNRGLPRDQILEEAELFLATRKELQASTNSATYAALSAVALHADLRQALRPNFAWLDRPTPVRIPMMESAMDYARLSLFAIVTLICLTGPGIAISFEASTSAYLMITAACTVLIALIVFWGRKPRPGEEAPGKLSILGTLLRQALLISVLLAVYIICASGMLVFPVEAVFRGPWADAGLRTLRSVALGLASLPLAITLVVLWLRYLERRDSSQDGPLTAPSAQREMAQHEDWIAQNHMGSVVMIKAGVLRSILVKVGHLGLGLVLRVQARNGYLGSMRTVHFAHWAFVNNSSRLLFFSNFDHSWGSYLDDFIEKAAGGLTLAWGAGAGFPATRFLVLDGASHGRQFKAWALASRAVSRFWYSAYRDLTVDQIERQARLAIGLRKRSLSTKEAETWRQDL